jgi:hypothetical protein
MKECEHVLREVDNAGRIGIFECVHCGKRVVGGMEIYDQYETVKQPNPLFILPRPKTAKNTLILAWLLIGALAVFAVVLVAIKFIG